LVKARLFAGLRLITPKITANTVSHNLPRCYRNNAVPERIRRSWNFLNFFIIRGVFFNKKLNGVEILKILIKPDLNIVGLIG